MSENQYNELFETIKSNFVSKVQLEKSKLETSQLKSELENAKEELKRMKLKYEEEKLKNEIIQAEKECLEAERKTFELRFNEISLKLKLKTNQYDSLLSSEKTGCISNDTEKTSIGTQTVKEEPNEIGIVNVPTSTSEIGTKRTSSVSTDDQRKKAKRKKTSPSNSKTPKTRKSTQNEFKFNCVICIYSWGRDIQADFGGDPDQENIPDPRQSISSFSSFEALKNHCINDHDIPEEGFCKETSCLEYKVHWNAPHGQNICKICDLSFKFQKHLDEHMDIEHVDLEMTNKQFYDLYLKYKNADYLH